MFRFSEVAHFDRATRSQRVSPSVKRSLNNSLYPLISLSCSPLARNWCLSKFNGPLSHRCHSAVTSMLKIIQHVKGKKKKNTRFQLIQHDRVIVSQQAVQARPSNYLIPYYNIGAVLQWHSYSAFLSCTVFWKLRDCLRLFLFFHWAVSQWLQAAYHWIWKKKNTYHMFPRRCGACMLSLCLCGFSPGFPATSHSPKTWVWGELETLNSPSVCMWVRLLVCLYVAPRWTGDLSRGPPCLRATTPGRGSIRHPGPWAHISNVRSWGHPADTSKPSKLWANGSLLFALDTHTFAQAVPKAKIPASGDAQPGRKITGVKTSRKVTWRHGEPRLMADVLPSRVGCDAAVRPFVLLGHLQDLQHPGGEGNEPVASGREVETHQVNESSE